MSMILLSLVAGALHAAPIQTKARACATDGTERLEVATAADGSAQEVRYDKQALHKAGCFQQNVPGARFTRCTYVNDQGLRVELLSDVRTPAGSSKQGGVMVWQGDEVIDSLTGWCRPR